MLALIRVMGGTHGDPEGCVMCHDGKPKPAAKGAPTFYPDPGAMGANPDPFPTPLQKVPRPTVEQIEACPKLAAFTYPRQSCLRCQVSVRGPEKRSMGWPSCHILYCDGRYHETTIRPSTGNRTATC